MNNRIQKVLSQAGYGSRREIERWIEEGRISVNGQPATLGQSVSLSDRITLNKRPVSVRQRMPTTTQVLIYNKPVGEVSSFKDPEGRPTVFQRLPKLSQGKWIMIGRLDINTAGLLLFTNNGQLANALMHPKQEIERVYRVRVLGEPKAELLDKLLQPTDIGDGDMAKFDAYVIDPVNPEEDKVNRWLSVSLHEGKNREVRKLLETLGLQVNRLIRIRYGSVDLPKNLRQGKYDLLSDKDIQALKALTKPAKPEKDISAQPTPKAPHKKIQAKPKAKAQIKAVKPQSSEKRFKPHNKN